ncbi:hypothetical protein NDU88_006366 [Pleurodeles waltl]|uniref:Uncharacterized protein n=1 Tax=Pleurodeles waltl TaxID=8319 RepID=A0AAV7WXE3_PLEWA|nr:hypothetical protein NDU88_006366 [Pleurodeles waltl]
MTLAQPNARLSFSAYGPTCSKFLHVYLYTPPILDYISSEVHPKSPPTHIQASGGPGHLSVAGCDVTKRHPDQNEKDEEGREWGTHTLGVVEEERTGVSEKQEKAEGRGAADDGMEAVASETIRSELTTREARTAIGTIHVPAGTWLTQFSLTFIISHRRASPGRTGCSVERSAPFTYRI